MAAAEARPIDTPAATTMSTDEITTWGATRSQLEAILEGMAEGLLVLNPETSKVLYLNEAARGLLGFSRNQGTDHTTDWYAERFQLHHPDGREVALDERPSQRILRGETFIGLVMQVTRSDKVQPDDGQPDNARLNPVPSWTGSFSGTLVKDSIVLGVVTMQDVSLRLEAETGFRTIFRASPTPTSIIRVSDGVFVDTNASFTEMTGYDRDELLGRTPPDVNLHVETEKRNLVLKRGQTSGSLPPLDRDLRRKDGSHVRVETTGEVITLNGEPHLLDTFIDITEQRRTEEELLQAIEEVMRDTSWFSRSVVEKLANLRVRAQDAEPPIEIRELTRRERQVLGALAQGLSNDQIAANLDISRNTVRNYVAGVYGKLGVSSRAEAVVWARERGIID